MRSTILLGLLASLLQLTPSSLHAADPARPNILFILADDLGWGDLGCYGNTFIRTPNLDRLARQGSLWTQFYVNGSVCSPTRSAFMTGRFPARFGLHGHLATPANNQSRGMPNWLDPKTTTLPRLLHDAGYATAHFGKWHLGSGQGAPIPAAYGFDTSRCVNGNGPKWEQEQTDPYFRAKSSTLIVDEALRFIDAHSNQPFYINLWSLVPHAPLHPTDEQLKGYAQFHVPAAPYNSARQIYYASVTDLDIQIGRLLQRLDELKLADNTLVFFSSDNGPEDIFINNAGHSGVGSSGPFRGRKRSLYEGGVRVPFIVRWPGHVPAGRVDDTSLVSGVDFLPTLCRLTGITLPAGYEGDGEDRSAVLLGTKQERTKPLLWEWRFNIAGHVLHHSPMLSIREGKWKLLLNPDRSRVELYDIPSDPSELQNLAARNPDVVEDLAKKALAWQQTLPKGPIQPGAGKANYPFPKAKDGNR